MKHKLHMFKEAPWRWPTVKAETCHSTVHQIDVLCSKFVLNLRT